MANGFTYDVFLSHNAQDKPRVLKLAERLRDAGLRVWLYEWIIRPGDDIYLAIERGLEAARVQVLCLSPEALGSEWVTLERSTVLFRDPTNAGRRFVPLLLAECKLPDTLRRYKYVDFRQETQAAFDELLAACRGEMETVPPAPGVRIQKPAKRKAKLPKPPQQREPLAVLERTLTGHEGPVNSLAISHDGTWVASASNDGTVKIWDLKTGECQATLTGHTGTVETVAITPDGKSVVSGWYDSTIRVWDVGSQTLMHTRLIEGSFFVLSVDMVPASNTLLYVGSYNGNNNSGIWRVSWFRGVIEIETVAMASHVRSRQMANAL